MRRSVAIKASKELQNDEDQTGQFIWHQFKQAIILDEQMKVLPSMMSFSAQCLQGCYDDLKMVLAQHKST
jgi:hypothetical protein